MSATTRVAKPLRDSRVSSRGLIEEADMIKLTDEEILEVDNKLCSDYLYIDEKDGEKSLLYSIGQFNKAQLKKVGDWADEACNEHTIGINGKLKRRQCPECWQALLEEVR